MRFCLATNVNPLPNSKRNFERLSFLELMKTKPFGAVWDYYCMMNKVPAGQDYIKEVRKYEEKVLSKR